MMWKQGGTILRNYLHNPHPPPPAIPFKTKVCREKNSRKRRRDRETERQRDRDTERDSEKQREAERGIDRDAVDGHKCRGNSFSVGVGGKPEDVRSGRA